MRLLSFLAEIERGLTGSSGTEGDWQTGRMLNFRLGLARMTIKPRLGPGAAGSILLQAFTLADGSRCLKASLAWEGSDEVLVIPVYSRPARNARMEALPIAAAWLRGPSGQARGAAPEDSSRLAEAG